MSAKSMYDLRENLCTELDQYSKKGALARADLEAVHLMTDSIKNIDKINMMEEQGNSYGDWYANGSYANGMMYDRGSGRRGRYSNDGYSGNRYRSGGYSNEGQDFENRMYREMNY